MDEGARPRAAAAIGVVALAGILCLRSFQPPEGSPITGVTSIPTASTAPPAPVEPPPVDHPALIAAGLLDPPSAPVTVRPSSGPDVVLQRVPLDTDEVVFYLAGSIENLEK